MKEKIDELDDDEIVIELMAIVSLLKDGHTGIYPVGFDSVSFNSWFPIRLYIFGDKLYITGAEKNNKELFASEVLKFNSIDASEVLKSIKKIINMDIFSRVKEWVPFYLSNASFSYIDYYNNLPNVDSTPLYLNNLKSNILLN